MDKGKAMGNPWKDPCAECAEGALERGIGGRFSKIKRNADGQVNLRKNVKDLLSAQAVARTKRGRRRCRCTILPIRLPTLTVPSRLGPPVYFFLRL